MSQTTGNNAERRTKSSQNNTDFKARTKHEETSEESLEVERRDGFVKSTDQSSVPGKN
jgi:hypothetical protein